MAKWEGEQSRSVLFINYEDPAQKLQDFGERTDDMLITIANETAIPDYMKTYLITRQQLGERALLLASEIREAGAKATPSLPEPDSVDIDTEWSRFRPADE